jgi:allantoate deiminase
MIEGSECDAGTIDRKDFPGEASGARAVARCDRIGCAPYSDEPDMLFRPYLGPGYRATFDILDAWMRDAGMAVRIDAAGNLVGRYEGVERDARTLLIGSHIDSVRDAGRYDGPLGIMLGIECVAALAADRRRFPFAIEVIAFGDEEGSRFASPMLCSRAVAGTLDHDLDLVDRAGISLPAALTAFGLDAGSFTDAARRKTDILAYLEAHIEQGPVLEAEGLAIGIVTGIAAQVRLDVKLRGCAGHAGTTTMPLRRDALAAAAKCISAIEHIAQSGPPDLVATVGQLTLSPGAVNVIPGQVDFSIDIRAGIPAARDTARCQIEQALKDIGNTRGVQIAVTETQALDASPCDAGLTDMMADAVAALGHPPRRLMSGAGHDAMILSALAPMAMLFIRCGGGISHNPAENVDALDVDIALRAMLAFIERLANQKVEPTV